MEKSLVLLASPSGISTDQEIEILIAQESSGISTDQDIDKEIRRSIGRLGYRLGDCATDLEFNQEIVIWKCLVWLDLPTPISTNWDINWGIRRLIVRSIDQGSYGISTYLYIDWDVRRSIGSSIGRLCWIRDLCWWHRPLD